MDLKQRFGGRLDPPLHLRSPKSKKPAKKKTSKKEGKRWEENLQDAVRVRRVGVDPLADLCVRLGLLRLHGVHEERPRGATEPDFQLVQTTVRTGSHNIFCRFTPVHIFFYVNTHNRIVSVHIGSHKISRRFAPVHIIFCVG